MVLGKDEVFISYKSEDRPLVEPIVELLRREGFRCWWDQDIRAEWSAEIDYALEQSRLVIAILTERAVRSDFVYAECETAKSAGKLLPVRLDSAPLPYHFRAITSLLNYIDYRHGDEVSEKRLAERVRSLIGEAGSSDRSIAVNVSHVTSKRVDSIFFPDRLHRVLPYAASLSLFEGYPHEAVYSNAIALRETLIKHRIIGDGTQNSLGMRQTDLLEAAGAVKKSREVSYRPMPVETVEFENPEDARILLSTLWGQFDELRAPFIDWLSEIILKGPQSLDNVALAVSSLLSSHFNSVFHLVVDDWICGTDPKKIECADKALSLACADERLEDFFRTWLPALSDNSARASSLRVAIRLSCGFLGLRVPDSSFALLSAIDRDVQSGALSKSGIDAIIQEVDRALNRLVKAAHADPYCRASMRHFIGRFAVCIQGSVDEDQYALPEYVLFQALRRLVAGRKTIDVDGASTVTDDQTGAMDQSAPTTDLNDESADLPTTHISIAYLLSGDAGDQSLLVDSIAALMEKWMSARATRSRAETLLKRWCREAAAAEKSGFSRDKALEHLINNIYNRATDPDSKSRIAYCVRDFKKAF